MEAGYTIERHDLSDPKIIGGFVMNWHGLNEVDICPIRNWDISSYMHSALNNIKENIVAIIRIKRKS